MQFEQLSQRHPKWKNIKLGYGSGTIGAYGCTLTALSMFAGTTPDKLNIMLKGSSFRDSAFAGSTRNLINWTKLEKYTKGLISFHWRGYGYDKAKIKQAVADHGACLIEVDFDGSPRTDDRHWVLYIGDKKLLDPWTGNEVPSNKYPIWTGWAEIEVNRKEDMSDCPNMYKGLDLCNQASMKVAVDVWDDVINKKIYIKETECQDRVNQAVAPLQDKIMTLEGKLALAEKEIKELNEEKDQLIKERNNALDALKECQESKPEPITPPDESDVKWIANGKTVTVKKDDTTTTINYAVDRKK